MAPMPASLLNLVSVSSMSLNRKDWPFLSSTKVFLSQTVRHRKCGEGGEDG